MNKEGNLEIESLINYFLIQCKVSPTYYIKQKKNMNSKVNKFLPSNICSENIKIMPHRLKTGNIRYNKIIILNNIRKFLKYRKSKQLHKEAINEHDKSELTS